MARGYHVAADRTLLNVVGRDAAKGRAVSVHELPAGSDALRAQIAALRRLIDRQGHAPTDRRWKRSIGADISSSC
jgi:hypothetical protein